MNNHCEYIDTLTNKECKKTKKKNKNLCCFHFKQYAKKHFIKLSILEIKGILHYVDETNGNVYSTKDILLNIPNPQIIMNYSDTNNTDTHKKI
uniref:Uncharacterized protein n=1 Tax=viral metagenome TaxID=1070528 RepID=A0A6C0H762_9ZZZZ